MRASLRALLPCIVALCAGGVLGACGKDAKPAERPVPHLAKPVYPRCGTGGFQPPETSELPKRIGYQVVYKIVERPPFRPPAGATTIVNVVEQSAAAPPRRNLGERPVTVAGRHVSLRTDPSPAAHVARWVTKAARYAVIANGTDMSTLRRFIACLP